MKVVALDLGFQFLLGRLETTAVKFKRWSYYMFQFLLGRLETFSVTTDYLLGKRFQFLLGRLETLCSNLLGHAVQVSIPLR